MFIVERKGEGWTKCGEREGEGKRKKGMDRKREGRRKKSKEREGEGWKRSVERN